MSKLDDALTSALDTVGEKLEPALYDLLARQMPDLGALLASTCTASELDEGPLADVHWYLQEDDNRGKLADKIRAVRVELDQFRCILADAVNPNL